ncbi:hypothetical protein WDW86_07840 [Bdellovibrionota bacterium FG-2]
MAPERPRVEEQTARTPAAETANAQSGKQQVLAPKKRSPSKFANAFSTSPLGHQLKRYVRSLAHHEAGAEELRNTSLGNLRADPSVAVSEIQRTLERMPRDDGAEEKIQLLELAASLTEDSREISELALRIATGDLHDVRDEHDKSAYEAYGLPTGALDVFLSHTSDPRDAIEGTVATMSAQKNPAARRLILKLFKVSRADLAQNLLDQLERQHIDVPGITSDLASN